MVRQASERLACLLGEELNADSDRIDVLRYGLEIILGGIVKLLLTTLFSYVLGIFKTTMIFIIIYIPFRHFGGGVHLSTYYRCLTVGLTMFLLLGKLATLQVGSKFILWAIIIVFLLGVYILTKWVPARTDKKAIASKGERLSQKRKTFTILTLISIANIILVKFNFINYAFASTLGISLSLFFITPLGYRVMHALDDIINKLQGGIKNA